MKQIIDVKLTTRNVDFSGCKTDVLVVGVFSDTKKLDPVNARLDKKLAGAIGRLIKLGDFKGADKTSAIAYGNEKIGARRVLLVGLGEKDKATVDTIRKAAANAAKKSVEIKAKTVALALHNAFGRRFDLSAVGKACGEGTYFGSYIYDEFVTENKDGRLSSLKVEMIDPDLAKLRQLKKGLSAGAVIGRSQSFARTLANRPGNIIYPAKLAAAAKEVARGSKRLSCTAFDSGGISIKPAANMDEMKLDKTGGIAVLGTMKALAELDLPVRVYGIIPSAENLPGGSSYRPGDIINTFSGKNVEVQNTDAEGRIILCDALAYAVKQKCEVVIDIATLTGACMVALGKHMAGLMGNDEELIKQIQKASEDSGEKVWPMPSGEEYAEEMKSKIADLKNIGSRWGGACTAAAFLRQFIGEAKWGHLDIAGMDLIQSASEFSAVGSSGFGVRLLTTYLMNLVDKKK